MKTKRIKIENVSNNERGFRVVLALGMISGILVGAVYTPAIMLALALTSIYLVTTAIVGSDPVYAVAQSMSIKRIAHYGRSLTA